MSIRRLDRVDHRIAAAIKKGDFGAARRIVRDKYGGSLRAGQVTGGTP